jgi:polyisoprenoid-binding protein YceI
MRTTLKLFLFVLLAGFATNAMAQANQNASRYVFASDTQIFIDGTSTIHDWTCDVTKSSGSYAVGASASPTDIASGQFVVMVDDIDCGKGQMNKKMKNALTGNDAKSITFKLTSATATEKANQTFGLALAGTLEIAGVTKPIELTATGSKTGNNKVKFEGSVSLVMSEYGIDPPTALLGTLHTGDEVTIRFAVVANPELNK